MTEPQPVRIRIDGRTVEARAGEPAAVALYRAGILTLGRSLKFHRPRGLWCMQGACNRCHATVDGVPNTPTCRVACRDGLQIRRPRGFPGAGLDLLRATDVLLPEVDHMRFLARAPILDAAFRFAAPRLTQHGAPPLQGPASAPPQERNVDVLVVGCGRAGSLAATALQEAAVDHVVLADETGGHRAPQPAPAGHVEGEALGAYPEDGVVLARDATGLVRYRPKGIVIATGGMDAPLLVAGADLPGVIGARALWRLLHRWNTRPPAPVVVAGDAEPVRAPLEAAGIDFTLIGCPDRVLGWDRATHAVVGGERVACATIVASVGAIAEVHLAQQAGASLRPDPSTGWAAARDKDGQAAAGLAVVGLPAGVTDDIAADTRNAVERLAEGIRRGRRWAGG